MTAWDLLDCIPDRPPPPPGSPFRGEATVWGIRGGYQEHLFDMFVISADDVRSPLASMWSGYDQIICEYRWFSPPHFWACVLGEEGVVTIEVQIKP